MSSLLKKLLAIIKVATIQLALGCGVLLIITGGITLIAGDLLGLAVALAGILLLLCGGSISCSLIKEQGWD